jgi:hypothetical protein
MAGVRGGSTGALAADAGMLVVTELSRAARTPRLGLGVAQGVGWGLYPGRHRSLHLNMLTVLRSQENRPAVGSGSHGTPLPSHWHCYAARLMIQDEAAMVQLKEVWY